MEASQGASGTKAVEGGGYRGSEFLGDVRAECWQAERARLPARVEGEGAGLEGEEGGPGPP